MRHHHPHHPHQHDLPHPHRHTHPNRRRMGESIVGKPDNTLATFLADPTEFQWVLSKVINEGPPSKQVRNAMILSQLSELVRMISSATGKVPTPVSGIEIESDDPESEDYTFPVQLPETLFSGMRNTDEVLAMVEEGPAHDVLRDILIMAVLNWSKETFNVKAL